MTPEQIELHEALLRKAKEILATARAMLSVWDDYVSRQKPQPTVIQDPDPVAIHQQINRRR